MAQSKKRNWCFTTFALPDEEGDGFQMPDKHEHFRYGVMQIEECPETGRLHYQGYLEFTTPKTMAQVKSMCTDDSMHLEGRRGTAKQAREYCMKQDSRLAGTEPKEFGEVPVGGQQGKRSDLADMYAKIKGGAKLQEIADEFPASYMRYWRSVGHIKQLPVAEIQERTQELTVALFIGKPGTGKTRAAYQFAKDTEQQIWACPVRAGKTLWFDGLNGQPIVLLDDFSGTIELTQLLRLLDRYPVPVEVKGGHIYWCPTTIIVTTNVHPRDWYDYSKRTSSMQALKRRFHFVMDFDGELDERGLPTRQEMNDWWPEETALDVIMTDYVRPARPTKKNCDES